MSRHDSPCVGDSDGSLHPAENLQALDFPCNVVEPSNTKPLKEALAAFTLAEQHIKSAEIAGSDIDIPSVNELRYFGFHICKALSYEKEDGALQLEEIKKAHKHCKRASFDAIELGLVEALEEIRDFDELFSGKVVISSVISSYADKMSQVDQISDTIQKHNKADRDEYYSESLGFLKELRDIARFLKKSKDDLAVRMQENNNAESRATKAEKTTRYSIAIAILVPLLTVGFNSYKASPVDSAVVIDSGTACTPALGLKKE